MRYRSSKQMGATGALVLASVLVVAVGGLVLAGCGERKVTVHYEQQPAYVEPAPAEVVIAPQEPPPMRVEVIPAAPGPDFIWVQGHYEWHHGHYEWIPGHHERAPELSVWVPAAWVRVEHGWRYVPGYWVRQGPVVVEQPPVGVIIVPKAPPPPPAEVITVAPSHLHVWIAGHYVWRDNSYFWVKGRYDLPPREHAAWVQDRWEKTDHGWRYEQGHWK